MLGFTATPRLHLQMQLWLPEYEETVDQGSIEVHQRPGDAQSLDGFPPPVLHNLRQQHNEPNAHAYDPAGVSYRKHRKSNPSTAVLKEQGRDVITHSELLLTVSQTWWWQLYDVR